MSEKKKIEMEMIYQKMVEGVQDYAIIFLEKDGTILTWNQGVEKIEGFTEDEIIGQNFSIFYLPQDRQAGLPSKLLNEATKNGIAKHTGKRIRKNGTTFWGSIVLTAIKGEDGELIGFTKLTRELKEGEKE